MPVTPNYGLSIPVGGTTPGASNNTTAGTYPYMIVADLDIIDNMYGSAVPVPSSGISINADLSFNGYNITDVGSVTASTEITTPVINMGSAGLDFGTAPPVTGTWPTGWFRFNLTPSAGGNLGWSCISGGTPGTWKEAGLIST